MNRFRAIALLAIYFWKHVFLKLMLLYRAGGSDRFVANYAPDRVLPIPDHVRQSLPAWHGCIGCGLCDAVGPRPEVSVMTLVGAGLRDFTMREDVAGNAQAVLDAGDCSAMERLCPVRVPIGEVLRFLATGE
jgi:ferredoxin